MSTTQQEPDASVCPECGAEEYGPVPKWTVTPEGATYVAVMRCEVCGYLERTQEHAEP